MSSACKKNILNIHNQNEATQSTKNIYSDFLNGHWRYFKPYYLFFDDNTRQYILILTFIIKFQLTKVYVYTTIVKTSFLG